MSIPIPPSALEAGARVVAEYRTGIRSDVGIARAAFLAMIEAWPGSNEWHEAANWPENVLILPLTEQNDE